MKEETNKTSEDEENKEKGSRGRKRAQVTADYIKSIDLTSLDGC